LQAISPKKKEEANLKLSASWAGLNPRIGEFNLSLERLLSIEL